ncbi:hypothetical protein PBI_SCTP2_333 [Salicola phage SCTP-2]|nr:hypothetical protein PBI_SCTP2_333 [Salicola phage SCTP-2]
MSNKTTKYDKRCENLKEKMSGFVNPIIDYRFDPWRDLTRSAFGGIIRDMVAFFVAENYGGNVNFYRGYHVPSKFTIQWFDEFLEDQVGYSTIKDFYFRNIDTFKKQVEDIQIDNPESENAVVVYSQTYRGFIRSDNHGIITIGPEEYATKFDYFMSEELTKYAIAKCILPEGYYDDEYSMKDDMIIVKPKRSELYKKSETYLDFDD